MKANPKILILGNRGFIGAALYAHFKTNTNIKVTGFNSSDVDLASPDSFRKIEKAVDKDTSVVFTIRAPKSPEPLKAFEQDIAITCNIARFLNGSSMNKFLYFSSTSVYGDDVINLSIEEQTKNAPSSYYGISKMVGERLLQKAAQDRGTPFITLRPCMIYGPGNKELPYGPDCLIHSLINKGKVELFGDGSELRDFLFLEDLVKITEKFIFSDCEGIFNIGSGNSSSLLGIVDILRKITKSNFPIVKLPRKKEKIDQKLDISKLLDLFPKYTFTPLEEGLRKSYETFQATQNRNNMGTVNL
jgi:UDP-glucose 4-epimerase